MLLIATDEAGYGPQLGPLVVAATVWRLPKLQPLTALAPLTAVLQLPGMPKLSIGDSKAVFKPHQATGLLALEAITMSSMQWAFPLQSRQRLRCLLGRISGSDVEPLECLPWYAPPAFDQRYLSCAALEASPEPLADQLISAWSARGARLLDVRQRVIDARRFNGLLQERQINKAQLLSETTAGLVVDLLQEHRDPTVAVYCDRHGGRAYYGGLLQHFLPAARLKILGETRHESRYELRQGPRSIEWRFTVKGDAFAPVSLASMFAKYSRERLMGCFNAFWQSHCSEALRPTAGYPTDAARFLSDIQRTIEQRNVAREDLVRSR